MGELVDGEIQRRELQPLRFGSRKAIFTQIPVYNGNRTRKDRNAKAFQRKQEGKSKGEFALLKALRHGQDSLTRQSSESEC